MHATKTLAAEKQNLIRVKNLDGTITQRTDEKPRKSYEDVMIMYLESNSRAHSHETDEEIKLIEHV